MKIRNPKLPPSDPEIPRLPLPPKYGTEGPYRFAVWRDDELTGWFAGHPWMMATVDAILRFMRDVKRNPHRR